jgi:hypothetical protein
MKTSSYMRGMALILILGTSGRLYAEAEVVCDIEVAAPTNVDCGSAWPFPVGEDHLVFCHTEASPSCCIWFYFEVCESSDVQLHIPGKGGVLASLQDPCSALSSPDTIAVSTAGALNYDDVLAPGRYYIIYCHTDCDSVASINISLTGAYSGCSEIPCEGCIPEFSPTPESCYRLTAWVHEVDAPGDQVVFDAPSITVMFEGSAQPDSVFITHGAIIDGWQRIEGEFCIPPDASDLYIYFSAAEGHTVNFDDVRIFPQKGSMKCYVYDPRDLRFVAELDERHYATFYEYDNEGKLARVKKETERGIMTIQETRYNSSKLSGE